LRKPAPEFNTATERGRYGECVAAWALRRQGYKVLARNWRSGGGEVDLVCRHKKTLVFVEVKLRGSGAWVEPADAVDRNKRRRIGNAARLYLKQLRQSQVPIRFDVVEVLADSGTPPAVKVLTDAFRFE
jgi:putative endonuclease